MQVKRQKTQQVAVVRSDNNSSIFYLLAAVASGLLIYFGQSMI